MKILYTFDLSFKCKIINFKRNLRQRIKWIIISNQINWMKNWLKNTQMKKSQSHLHLISLNKATEQAIVLHSRHAQLWILPSINNLRKLRGRKRISFVMAKSWGLMQASLETMTWLMHHLLWLCSNKNYKELKSIRSKFIQNLILTDQMAQRITMNERKLRNTIK